MLTNNLVWNFFKSVKLALFTFFILASTSIIGTVIPQNNPPEFYVQQYGASTAKLFQMLGIPNMYNAWWYLFLLVLFSINLIVCSINRIPDAWRRVTADIFAVSREHLGKMRTRVLLTSRLPVADAAPLLKEIMAKAGWRPKRADRNGDVMFAAQKGPWTRLGVYFVHLSILIIFIGAIIGATFGYKASIMLPELSSSNVVFERATGKPIKLGFSIRCDRFDLSYYDNGAPKEYRSDITILENGKEVLSHPLIVNDPLTYKGITFYQSSYNGLEEFVLTLEDQTTKAKRSFRAPPGRKIVWPQTGVAFGIINFQGPDRLGQYRLKIWFSDGKSAPTQFWLDSSRSATLQRPDTTYLISSKQFFATGLQVARDPGVWYVYTGCTMMLLGLAVAFFLSHKKVWIYISDKDGRSELLVSGTSNKNALGFEKNFEALVGRIRQQSEKLQLKG